MNILGILVVYDEERASVAEVNFGKLLEECSGAYSLVTVTNNNKVVSGDVKGTNKAAEFSGWDEGVSSCDLKEYDVILFANDTYCTRREFGRCDIDALRKSLTAPRKAPYISGEVCWSLNYRRLILGRRFLLRWIRTSIFAVSKNAFLRLGKVGVTTNELESLLSLNNGNRIEYREDIPLLVRNRIDAWLFPDAPGAGWHSAKNVSCDILLLKAKSVLQELFLARECELKKVCVVDVYPWSPKKAIFRFLYAFQKILPE